jgi:DNA repair photolyase
MIHEIHAKSLLNTVKGPDSWFGLKYNMNLYRGCQHQCIYCDSRSLCYQIEDFSDIIVKINAIDLLRTELVSKRVKGTIGTGSMNDPYMPIEKQYNLSGRALEVIAQFRFPIHILTKSDLVLKDLDSLRTISQVHAVVSFTITTADDDLAHILEPGAPPPSARFKALRLLASNGIQTGITLMPILPFIEDSISNINTIVQKAKQNGANYILPSFGMTLRDRQRSYYYNKLDIHFPGLSEQYHHTFGSDYFAPAQKMESLYKHFYALCERYNIPTTIPKYKCEEQVSQLALF